MNKLLKQDQFKCFEGLFLRCVVGINRTHFWPSACAEFAFVLSSSCVPVALRNPIEPLKRPVCTCSCTGATCINHCWGSHCLWQEEHLKGSPGQSGVSSTGLGKNNLKIFFHKSSLCKVFLLQKFTVFRGVKNNSFVKQGACGFTKCKWACSWIPRESFPAAQILEPCV